MAAYIQDYSDLYYPGTKCVSIIMNDTTKFEENIDEMYKILSSYDHSVIHIHAYDFTISILRDIRSNSKFDEEKYDEIVYDYPAVLLESTYIFSDPDITLNETDLDGVYFIDTLSFESSEMTALNIEESVGDISYLKVTDAMNLLETIHSLQDLYAVVGSLSRNAMASYLMGVEMNTMEGTLLIDGSFTVSKCAKIFQFTNLTYQRTFQETFCYKPQVYNVYENETEYYTCDWVLNTDNNKTEGNQLSFGYVTDLTYSKWSIRYEMDSIWDNIEYLNKNGGIDKHYVRLFTETCPTNETEAIALFERFEKIGIKVIIGGCKPIYRHLIEQHLVEYDMLLFATNDYEGNSCEENVFYFRETPSQIILPATFYMVSQVAVVNLVFFVSDDEQSQALRVFCEDLLENFGAPLLQVFTVNASLSTPLDEQIRQYSTQIAMVMNEGGVICNLMSNDQSQLYKSVYEMYHSSDTESLFRILDFMEVPVTVDPKYRVGSYFVDTFAPIPEFPSTMFYYNLRKKRSDFFSINRVIYTEYLALNVLGLIPSSSQQDLKEFKAQIYSTMSTNSIADGYTFTYDQHLKNNIFVGMYINETYIHYETVASNVIAEPYRTTFIEKDYHYICNHYNERIGKRFNKTVQPVYIGVDINNSLGSDDWDVIHTTATTLYTRNLVNDELPDTPYFGIKILGQSFYNGSMPVDVDAIFAVRDETLRNIIHARYPDLLLLSPYLAPGDSCESNMVHLGNLFTNYLAFITSLVHQYPDDSYIVFYSSHDESIKMKDQVINGLNEYNCNIAGSFAFPINSEYTEPLIENIAYHLPNGGIIINLLLSESGKALYKAMAENEYNPPTYLIVTSTIDINSIPTNELQYTVGHYFWSMKDYDKESEDGKNFENGFNVLFHDLSRFSSVSVCQYIALNYYIQTYDIKESLGEDSTKTFIEIMRENPLQNTLIGNVEIKNNNYATFDVMLFTTEYDEETATASKNILYYNLYPITPNPYRYFGVEKTVDYYTCDLVKGETKVLIPSYYIALLLPLTGSYAVNPIAYEEVITSVTKHINDIGGLNHTYVSYVVFDTKSTIEGTNAIFDILEIQKDNITSYIGCIDAICQEVAKKRLADKNFVWMPAVYAGQQCSNKLFVTGAVPNQYVTAIKDYLIGISTAKYAVFLYENYDEYRLLSDIVIATLKNYYTFYDTVVLSTNQLLKAANITDIVSKLPEGGLVFTLLTSNNFQLLVNGVLSRVVNPKDFIIIPLNLEDSDIKSLITDTSYLQQIFFYQTYYKPMSDNEYSLKNLLYNYVKETSVSSLSDNIYTALMFWFDAVSELGDTDMTNIYNYLYNVQVDTDSGYVQMYTNHHTSKYIFLFQYDSDGEKQLLKSSSYPLVPNPYSWALDSTYGKICNHNVTDGESLESRIIKIILGISLTGIYADSDKGISDAFTLVLDAINNQNPLLDSQIELLLVDIQEDSSACYAALTKEIDVDVSALFTTGDSECRELLATQLVENDVLLFALNNVAGESSNSHMIMATPDPSIFRYYIPYLLASPIHQYSIMAVNTDTGKIYSEYFNALITNNGGTVYVSVTVPITVTDVTSIVDNIINQMSKGIIFLIVPESIVILFDHALTAKGVAPFTYEIYSFMAGEEITGKVDNAYIILRTTFSVMSNTKLDMFKSEIEPLLGENIPVSQPIQLAYTFLNFYCGAVRDTNTLDTTTLLNYMYENNYESMIGDVQLDTNNMFPFKLRGYYTVYDIILYETYKPITPTPWKRELNGGLYTCDFSDSEVGDKYLQPSLRIGVIFLLHGTTVDPNMYDNLYINSALFGFDLINDAGGLHGQYIDPVLLVVKGDITDFKTQAVNTFSLLTTKFMVGGVTNEELEVAIELSNKYQKYWFFPGKTPGGTCPQYVIFSYPPPNLLIDAYLKAATRIGLFKLALISDESIVSQSYTNAISSIYTRLRDTMTVYNYTVKSTNIDEIVSDIKLHSNDIDGIVTTSDVTDNSDSIELLQKLYDEGMDGSKYIYIHINADENLNYFSSGIINNHYIITSFSESFSNTSDIGYNSLADDFIKNLRLRNGEIVRINPIMEGVYSAILLWKDTVDRVYNYDIANIKDNLYRREVSTPSGTLKLNANNYIDRIIYVLQFKNDIFSTVFMTDSPKTANPYNPFDPTELGYICDWSSTGNGMKYRRNIKWVVVVIEADRSLIVNSFLSWQIAGSVIDKINNGGSNLDYYYAYVTSMVYPNSNSSNSEIDKIFAAYKPSLIVGCVEVTCLVYI